MTTINLLPVNGRKSFGGKCKVETAQCVTTGDTISILLSYDTEVATYNHETNIMAVKDYFSAVTMTHTHKRFPQSFWI